MLDISITRHLNSQNNRKQVIVSTERKKSCSFCVGEALPGDTPKNNKVNPLIPLPDGKQEQESPFENLLKLLH